MISVIVPFRDWYLDRLETCLTHLRRFPSITEVIVVDFGSSQPVPDLPDCHVVRVEADRWCLSEANNIGISEATNDVVMKIDADVHLLLDEATLRGLADSVVSGQVAFHVLQPTDFDAKDGQHVRKRLRPSWSEGACNLFSRRDVIEIGGFDTRFYDYGGEDNDLCQRLRRYGKRVELFVSDKVLHERHPPSTARTHGHFSDHHKKALLEDGSIFRMHPFRHSSYENDSTFCPAITVAIATTDRPSREEHLYHCLRGLAAQTVRDFEVVICENGPPGSKRLDEAALRSAFPDLDIRLFSLDEPSIPKTRNLITDHARGFYIAVHDDDDFSVPARFEEQLECMAEHDGAHGCHSSWIEFDETNGRLTSYIGQSRDIEKLFRQQGKVTLHSTGFYRRDVLESFRYDESLTLGADYDLNIRMLLTGLEVPHTRKFHCMRRLHDSSVSSNGSATQREVARLSNGAYKYFLGEPFLDAIREEDQENLWVTGFPTIREMLALLPDSFGAFRIDLDLEAALALGLDPVFGRDSESRTCHFEGLDFVAAFQGFGQNTKFILRTDVPLTAGECLEKLPVFRKVLGVNVVSEVELKSSKLHSLQHLKVGQGQRRVISRLYENMAEAMEALPTELLGFGVAQLQFFAVNHPAEGVHMLLGTFDNVADLEYALRIANAGNSSDFFAVANQGKRGGFNGN